MSRPIDRAVDIVAFCVIAAACAAGLLWARDVPFIVAMVIFGLSIESWYVYRFVRQRRRQSGDEQDVPARRSGPDDA
jgi:Flp pilus assembly protein TadB